MGRILAPKSLVDESDGQLIRRFAEGRDERAFTKLVERHGALVAGVCARKLRNKADAEDAFQAVFLVLARRAHTLVRRDSLAGWLHKVAEHVSRNELRGRRRRQQRLREAEELAPKPSRIDRLGELKRSVDEELAFLSARAREVLVLCDLEGRTQAEAARILGVTPDTVATRLEDGREALRKRLVRHGLPITVGGVSFALAKCAEAAPRVSPQLIHTTVHNTRVFLTGINAMKSMQGAKISMLAESALRAMVVTQWKTGACLVAIFATTLFGGAVAPHVMPAAHAGFLETFDDVPSGTELHGAGLSGWDIKEGPIFANSEESASSPNSIGGDQSGRGVMFHAAADASTLYFSFLIAENSGSQSINVALVTSDAYDQFYHLLDYSAGPSIQFLEDRGEVEFVIYGEALPGDLPQEIVPLTDISAQTWYDGMIRIETDNTVTFGHKLRTDSDFTLSNGHALPPGFETEFVAVTMYGGNRLDNIGTIVPEPASAVLSLFTSIGMLAVWRTRRVAM